MKRKTKMTSRILHRVKTLGKILASIVLISLILLELTVIGINLVGGEEALAKLPLYILQVQSDSMYPRLRTGDCILSKDVDFNQLQVGDLITYYFNGHLVTHEVITINENGTVTTKGAMNTYADGEISEEYYIGKVICRLPGMSKILDMIKTPAQKFKMAVLVLVVCFGFPIGMKLIEAASAKLPAELEEEDEEDI